MLKKLLAGVMGFLMMLSSQAAFALSDEPLEEAPIKPNCAAALLFEPRSGQVIFEINADEERPVASVTKIMTILLVCEAVENGAVSTEDKVMVSGEAAGMGGSQVLLDAGETQSVGNLLKSVIVGSANDSAVALAEYIAGSVPLFVDRMNKRAEELGMEHTHFVNCTGLPAAGQHTTARDVGIMAGELIKHELYFDYSSLWLEDFEHESGRITTLTNTNKLLKTYDGCDGIKTGSTNEAGYCMAASAVRGTMRLVAVVLGAQSGKERFAIAKEMLDYGFAGYRVHPVAERGARVRGSLPVKGGNKDSIGLMLTTDLTLLIKKGEEDSISLEPCLPECVNAPIREGEKVGEVRILKNNVEIAVVPVGAAEGAEARSLTGGIKRVVDKWCFQ